MSKEYVIGKNPCRKCQEKGNDTAGDNFHWYGEGQGGYCHACGFTVPSEEWLKENKPINLEDMEYELRGKEFNEEVYEGLKSITTFDGNDYRGITKATSNYFGVRYEYDTEEGTVARSYYPITKGCTTGTPIKDCLTGFKIREHPKKFKVLGEFNKESDLFMQWRFLTHRGILVICAGEIDALSAYQILKENYDQRGKTQYDEIAVVSPVTGEGGSIAQLRNHYEWLDQFSKIIVCYDNDEAGREATNKVVEILPRGKAFIMQLRHKDVNEYLMKGDSKDFIKDFWGMRPYTPDGVKSSVDGFKELPLEIMRPRITLPDYMKVAQEMMGGGIGQGRIVNIVAATSVGKTSHVRRMVHHWLFNSPLLPTIVSVEETAAQYNLDLIQLHLKKNFTFNKTSEEILEFMQTEEFIKAEKELSLKEDGTPRFMIIDEISGAIENIEKQMEQLFKKYGSRLFIMDVLSDLLRGSNQDKAEDHMNFQKRMVKEGCTIVNVHHTIKPPRGENGKPRRITEYDALGTGAFVQSGHINIILNRDKVEEDNIIKNTTEVELSKCRGGHTGDAGRWFYDFNTATCYDFYDYRRDNPHLFVEK